MTQNVWLVDDNPADVYGSDVVCNSNEKAVATVEMFPFSVQCGNEATVWACAACVFWVYKPNGNASEFCFVFDKHAELMEAPRVLSATLALGSTFCKGADQSGGTS
jgi:hypothetical protein